MFGQWVISRTWGSRTSARGNQQFLPTANYEQALRLLHVTNQRRKARGYQLPSEQNCAKVVKRDEQRYSHGQIVLGTDGPTS